MSFRATLENGIVFYIADSVTNPTQYISLEFVDGKLRYEFRTTSGKVTISTDNRYTGAGSWNKVVKDIELKYSLY